jgi:hypothetical protein
MDDRETVAVEPRPEYEAPRVETLGSFYDVTAACFFDKKLGSPDYWSFIPISWCSS